MLKTTSISVYYQLTNGKWKSKPFLITAKYEIRKRDMTKDVQDLCTEKYKQLLGEMKEDMERYTVFVGEKTYYF